MIHCVVVDDKPLAIDILNDYISKVSGLLLAFSTTNPIEALEYVMRNHVDVVFLDIQMPQLNGVQFMKIVNDKCLIVLTTAYAAYALDGFENNAVDYLLKPIPFERFYKAVQKVMRQISLSAPVATGGKGGPVRPGMDYIFVKTEYRLIKINTDDILFVEGMQNYVSIQTTADKFLTLQSMKKTEEQLPQQHFIRIHKSFIIAVNKISSIERGRIYIGEAVLPLGDIYKEAFYRLIEGNSSD